MIAGLSLLSTDFFPGSLSADESCQPCDTEADKERDDPDKLRCPSKYISAQSRQQYQHTYAYRLTEIIDAVDMPSRHSKILFKA